MLEKPIIKMLLFFRIIRAALFAGATREFYNRISDIYDNVFTSHIIHIENIVGLLARIYSKKNCTVIDLGCGTGMLSKAIADKGFSVVGVDVSLESLQIIRCAHQPVSLIQADAEALPFSDCQFKVLVCLGVWRHLIHMELAIDEICRVLKKDGNFVLGYFPPKLGGLFHISENLWGRVLVNLYNNVVCRFGYGDLAGSDLERKTIQALYKRFEQVYKVDSGEHWHLVLAYGLQTRSNPL